MIINFFRKIKDSYHWQPWHAYLILALAAVIIYGQSLFFDYSYFDDQQLILEHADILERADPAEIFFNDVFFSSSKYYYRPLLTWSLVLDWHWGDTLVFAFHFSNIIFHIIAICLLYYLLRLIKIKEGMAVALSFLFAIHPALTQAVAWIPGRNDVLAAIFIFLTLIFLSLWFRRERFRDLIFLFFFFFLALLTKETSILLLVFALPWILIFEKENFSWLKFSLSTAGAAVFTFVWYLLRLMALNSSGVGLAWSSLLNNLLSPLIFLGKAILPFNLSVYPVLADTPWFLGIISLLLLMLLLLYSRPWRLGRVIFGFVWFWLFLLLGSIRPDSDIFRNFMEHRLYIPMFGLLIVLAETEKFWQRGSQSLRRYIYLGVLVLFIALSLVHIGSFKNRLTFWQQAVTSSPHAPLAWRNLGAMYYLDGNLDKAEPLFRQALALNPKEPMAHNNLGAIYLDQGDLWRAETELKKELEINPNYDVALYNLGRVYYERKHYDEAVMIWQEVLRLNPRHQEAAWRLYELELEKQKISESEKIN